MEINLKTVVRMPGMHGFYLGHPDILDRIPVHGFYVLDSLLCLPLWVELFCQSILCGVKTLIAIVVYNRFNNIQEWVRCWHMCPKDDAQIVVIHNLRGANDQRTYENFCVKNGLLYIARENKGFDIGAFQDVCRNRLPGIPDFEYLLWCTDDLVPMRKNFVQRYLDKFEPGVVAVCYELSKEVHPHIRTTGFMLHRDTLPKITFKVDPVLSKPDCYDFEHRDKVNSLMDQMQRLGKVVQVDDIENSCMWDSGMNSREAKARRSRRQIEHNKVFR